MTGIVAFLIKRLFSFFICQITWIETTTKIYKIQTTPSR
jgi:hypothetical protein